MQDQQPHDPWYRIFDRVYAEFHATLCRSAARLIGPRLRRRVDAEDIVQSVFRTFDRRNTAGECEFEDTSALRSYLLEITANKVRSQAQTHGAKRRNVACEVEVEGSANVPVSTVTRLTPAESAAIRDEIQFLTRKFSQRNLDILQLRFEGHTTPDIAELIGCSRWTVRRVLNGFGTCWQQRDQQICGG